MNPLAILHVIIFAAAVASQCPNGTDAAGFWPAIFYDMMLGIAACDGDTKRVQTLLADPRVDPAYDDNCAIIGAARNGHAGCVRLLLADQRVDPAAVNNSAIRMAASYGHARCIKLLLADRRVNPAADNNFAISWAAENGRTECVRLLLKDPRVDQAANNNRAIYEAVRNGHAECVRLLLAHSRVNPVARINNAFWWAAMRGHTACVSLLLADKRVDPAAEENRAIRLAALNGHMDCVKLLLADTRVDLAAIALYSEVPVTVSAIMSGCMDLVGVKVDSSETWMVPSGYVACRLVERTREFRDGDLDAFKQMDLADLSDDLLDVLILRNRSFPQVLDCLLGTQLAYLAVPMTVRENPGYKALLHLVRSKGLWRTDVLREVTKTFIRLRNTHPAFSDLAATITAQAYGLVPQGDLLMTQLAKTCSSHQE